MQGKRLSRTSTKKTSLRKNLFALCVLFFFKKIISFSVSPFDEGWSTGTNLSPICDPRKVEIFPHEVQAAIGNAPAKSDMLSDKAKIVTLMKRNLSRTKKVKTPLRREYIKEQAIAINFLKAKQKKKNPVAKRATTHWAVSPFDPAFDKLCTLPRSRPKSSKQRTL